MGTNHIIITPETTETPDFRIVRVALWSTDEVPMFQVRDVRTNDTVAVAHTFKAANNELCYATTRRSFKR